MMVFTEDIVDFQIQADLNKTQNSSFWEKNDNSSFESRYSVSTVIQKLSHKSRDFKKLTN